MSELLQSGNPLDAEHPDAQHPDADQLSAFAEHTLPEHEHRQTLIHLADCAACRNIVALCGPPPLEEPPAVEPVVASQPWIVGWFPGWRPAGNPLWIAAPLLTAVLILVIYLQRWSHGGGRVAPSAPVAEMHAPSNAASPQAPDTLNAPAPPRALHPTAAPAASVEPKPKVVGTEKSIGDLPFVGHDVRAAKLPPATTSHAPDSVAHAAMPVTASGIGAAQGQTGSALRAKKSPVIGLSLFKRSPRQTNPSREPASARQPQAGPPNLMAADEAPITVAGSNSTAALPPGSERYQPRGDSSGPASSFRRNTAVSIQAALPSGLPILSFAASLGQRLAIDTGHQLFFSEDAGQHWRSVASPWRGRAITISRISSPSARPQPPSQAVAFAVPERFTPGETAVVESDTPSNRLSGRITDASGGIIPHARVALTDGRTGVVRTVEADGNGRYSVANFVPGLYRIEARAPGLQTQSLLVDLSSASQAVKNITLVLGQASQTVTVEASNEPLETPSREASAPALKVKRVSAPQPVVFVVSTDDGERWSSYDGLNWKQE